MIHQVLHAQLVPDPEQVRRRARGIPELADSINEHGLLQNLVVRLSPQGKDTFLIVAGERRWQAIGVLISDGRWPSTKPVPVLVTSTDGVWQNIIENDHRHEVPPWELGHRYCELVESGYTQVEIGVRTGTTQGRVSRHMQLAQGLAPETIALLNKLTCHWTFNDLTKISKLTKPGRSIEEKVPDIEAQAEAVKKLAGVKGNRKVRAKRTETKGSAERVFARYKKLRDSLVGIDTPEERCIRSILNYLSGKDGRLKLEI